MSALDGWIDICRAGTWRDMQGHDVRLDEERLDRVVAMHTAADPAPIVIGHPEADAPAYAWIDGLRRVGDRLQAKLRDIAPSFREAVEAGRYSGRSIALQGDTLRHVGFLGGRAPAVPGLAPTRFATAPETVVAFIDDDGAESPDDSPADHSDSPRALEPGGDEDGDSLVSLPALQGRGEVDQDGRACPVVSPDRGDEVTGRVALAEREASLAAREEALLAREAAAAADERRRAAESALAPHVEAGRILPAERPALVALFAALEGDRGGAAAGGPAALARLAVRDPAALFARWQRESAPADSVVTALEIRHPAVPVPVRVVNDTVNRRIEGSDYIALRFDARLADDIAGQAPQAELAIDNIGRELTQWIEAAGGGIGATVRVMLVLAVPDPPVEWELTLDVAGINVDQERVTARLGFDPLLGGAAVTLRHDPQTSPGLF